MRTDVSDLEEGIAGQLPLDGEVILLGVLRSQIGLKLSVKNVGPEYGPIDRLAAYWIQNSVEGIGILRAVLAEERSIEQDIAEAGAAAERWLGTELFEHELLDGVVEDAVAHADAGLPALPNSFCPMPELADGLQAKPMRGAKDL